jgi:voltage-gated potassium channel Kch
VERAKAVITVVSSDPENLFITLSTRLLNPTVTIVAAVTGAENVPKRYPVDVPVSKLIGIGG